MRAPIERASCKRVLVVLQGIEPTQKAAADIARRIVVLSENFEVTILTSTPATCRGLFPRTKVLKLPSLPVRGGSGLFVLWCWLIMPFLRPNVVFVAGAINSPSAITVVGRPVLCYGNSHPLQHNLASSHKGGRVWSMIGALYSIAIVAGLRRTDAILAISPQLASIYQSPGVKPGRIVVSEIGVPRAFFRPPEKVNNKSRAVSVGVYHGTVSLERGLAVIVEGAKLLAMKRRDFRIKLVGCNDSEMRLVEGLVKNADVEGLFEIIPPINHSDMPDILWSADWGISLLEPNAYFEASPPAKVFEFLAAGLPVIANDIKTHRTYLKDDYNSIIIPYEAEAFSNAMQKIIENPDLRMRLSRNALTSASLLSDSGPLTTLVRAVRILAREGRGRFDFSKMLHAEA